MPYLKFDLLRAHVCSRLYSASKSSEGPEQRKTLRPDEIHVEMLTKHALGSSQPVHHDVDDGNASRQLERGVLLDSFQLSGGIPIILLHKTKDKSALQAYCIGKHHV